MMVVLFFIPFVLIAILYITIYIKLKSQKIPGEHSINAGQQRQQRERNLLKMAIAIVVGNVCSMLSAHQHRLVSLLVCIEHTVLWLPMLFLYYRCDGSCKLCYKSLHLFLFQ